MAAKKIVWTITYRQKFRRDPYWHDYKDTFIGEECLHQTLIKFTRKARDEDLSGQACVDVEVISATRGEAITRTL